MTTIAEATTHGLDVPGAVLTYDIRRAESTAPPLLLIGSPMGAGGFGTLARHFTDRTVVTYDPRGVERSTKADPASPSTPAEHADDLHRLIAELNAGPVDLFASSGGAVNALALVATHAEQVRTLVAHEPPLASSLPDREGALAACRAIHETYQRNGFGAGMARFIAAVSHQGPFGPDYAGQPAADPAMFGLPAEDDGTRSEPLLGQNMISSTHFEPDFDALRAASTLIVIAVGVESAGTLANRGAVAVAEWLGTTPVSFPSGHGGFLGGEYGQRGDPDAFAEKLREVLAEAWRGRPANGVRVNSSSTASHRFLSQWAPLLPMGRFYLSMPRTAGSGDAPGQPTRPPAPSCGSGWLQSCCPCSASPKPPTRRP